MKRMKKSDRAKFIRELVQKMFDDPDRDVEAFSDEPEKIDIGLAVEQDGWEFQRYILHEIDHVNITWRIFEAEPEHEGPNLEIEEAVKLMHQYLATRRYLEVHTTMNGADPFNQAETVHFQGEASFETLALFLKTKF